jgi:protein-S-isoprenylcysteine O-methyltransferase Ste14
LKTQRSADIAGGCFLVLLGLATIIAATKITGGLEERLPPRTLPYVVGVIILICGALLAIRSWRFRGEDPVIKWPDRRGKIRVLITLLSVGVYLALMEPLGLPLSTFLYVSFTVWYLGKYRLWYPLLIGFLSGAISYIVFIYLLELSFPVGPFLTR